MPVGDDINDAGAPVTSRVYWPCAPVVVDVSPVPVLMRWLLGSVGSFTRVRNDWVCEGDAAMAPVVVWTVTPFWTIGTDSAPVIAPAVGREVMVTFAIIAPEMD
jgi:hypothetical protein